MNNDPTTFDQIIGIPPTPNGYPGFNSALSRPFAPSSPYGGLQPPAAAALSPPQHALVQLLAHHIANNLASSAPGAFSKPSAPQPPAQKPPAPKASPQPSKPPYEVVRHPNAPGRYPFALQDNINGGYVAGGSPAFPRVFPTQADAQAAISTLGAPAASKPAFWPTADSGTPTLASLGQPRYQISLNPDAPARRPFGIWDNHLGDWHRDPFGLAYPFATEQDARENLPHEATGQGMEYSNRDPAASNTGKPLVAKPNLGKASPILSPAPHDVAQETLNGHANITSRPDASRNDIGTVTSHRGEDRHPPLPSASPLGIPPNHTTNESAAKTANGTYVAPSYYEAKLSRFIKSLGTSWSDKEPMLYMNGSQIAEYKGLMTQRDQSYLGDTDNAIKAVLAEQRANGKTGSNWQKYQQLLRARAYYKARVAFDQFIGSMPGDELGTPNCAIGAQQFLWALGVPWGNVPHSARAATMRDIVSEHKNTWQKVSYGDLRPGDLIFIPVTGGSGYHVAIYMGNDDISFQADGGEGLPRPYMRLAKYRKFYPKTRVGGRGVEYYHYSGPTENRKSGQGYPWARGFWSGYNNPHSRPSDNPAGHVIGDVHDSVVVGNPSRLAHVSGSAAAIGRGHAGSVRPTPSQRPGFGTEIVSGTEHLVHGLTTDVSNMAHFLAGYLPFHFGGHPAFSSGGTTHPAPVRARQVSAAPPARKVETYSMPGAPGKPVTFRDIYFAAKAAGDPHPLVAAAQWALESGWGKHQSGRYNFFGIKGPGRTVWTSEYKHGRKVAERASFRNYNSLEEGIADHTRLLRSHRYAGYGAAKTDEEAIEALVRGGYATDPHYASLLLSIIRHHGRGLH